MANRGYSRRCKGTGECELLVEGVDVHQTSALDQGTLREACLGATSCGMNLKAFTTFARLQSQKPYVKVQ
jgi:hypothetical protein